MRGYTYDLLGRMTQAGFGASSTTSPVYESTIAYTYDDAGRLTQIAQGSNTVQFAYDDANRRSTLTLANGITLTYGYDNANEVSAIAYRDSANNLLGDLSYAYDNAGRRTAVGGAFARTGLPDAVASAAYDANNRLTDWNGTNLSHDANGNLLGFQGDAYAWNSRDQLAGITGTNSASFQYDALGRRQAKTVAGTSMQFLYDGLNPVQELSGTTVTANVLAGGLDEYFLRTAGAATQHYLTDALGSTIRLTDNAGAKLVDYTYEPYGKASADAGSSNALQFTGRENDGTGLNYFRARYQSPVLGRFISEDPIGLMGGQNVYVYVNGNPTAYSDPAGLFNVVGGFGGSVVPVYGVEGSVAGFYNFGQEGGGGLVTSVGQGVGVNISADAFIGVIKGGISNLEGQTTNINVGVGPLSVTVMIDPKTNEVVGGTAGPGVGTTFISGSVTNSYSKIIARNRNPWWFGPIPLPWNWSATLCGP